MPDRPVPEPGWAQPYPDVGAGQVLTRVAPLHTDRVNDLTERLRRLLRRYAVALLRGFVLILETPVLAVVWCLAILALTTGVGLYWLPPAARAMAGLTIVGRVQARSWSGLDVEEPPHPQPPPFSRQPRQAWQRARVVLGHLVTWRDLAWLTCALVVGFGVGYAVLVLAGLGVAFTVVLPLVWWFGGDAAAAPMITSPEEAVGLVLLGLALLAVGVWLSPRLIDLHSRLAGLLLAPARNTVLVARVAQLRATQADTVDTQAVQMRRIERDLHDGAQSRLVTLALAIGEADRLLAAEAPDVASARRALDQARNGSLQALQELRDLVRGIHPPVLADRGLVDAVRAVALDSPLTVHVDADLPGRVCPPVETAVYFAVTELLTNATKHADARRVQVLLEAVGATLRVSVTDDGRGGADPAHGSGLVGLQRRMAALDGRLVVHSPPGGPTAATLEVPAAWPA